MDYATQQNIERFAKLFSSVMHIFHNLMHEVSKVADLSLAQYRLLMIINHYGPLSINQIRTHLNIAQSSASEMVNRLVQLGLLEGQKDESDRRMTLFKLTKKTLELQKKRQAMMRDLYHKVLEPLTPAEQTQLVEAFETIAQLMQRFEIQK